MLLVTNRGGEEKRERVVCAEPSPDAMSALAFSGALEGAFEGGTAGASGSFGQALGELGERTPVVQILRDDLYRACEAHMNGLLSKEEYYEILVFFDIYSATILGIESLTHAQRPAVTISASATASGSGQTNTTTDKDKQEGTAKQETKAESKGEGTDAKPVAVTVSKDVADAVKGILTSYYETKLKLVCLLQLLAPEKSAYTVLHDSKDEKGQDILVQQKIAPITKEEEKSYCSEYVKTSPATAGRASPASFTDMPPAKPSKRR